MKYLILPILLAIFGFSLFKLSDKDHKAYATLLENSRPTKKAIVYQSKQKRSGVLKEVWNQDKYCRIESTDSNLTFSSQDQEITVIEKLSNVRCLLQEKLYYDEKNQPRQLVRYMTAPKATYHYHSQLFVASDVTIWQYSLEGHDPVLIPPNQGLLLSGTSESIRFTLNNKTPDFEASILFTHLYDYEDTKLWAKQGHYDGTHIVLTGEVTLENANEQYALAHRATYYPDKEWMELEGLENKVLFYDRQRDMQISSKKVQINTATKSVQGVGDVHLIFAPEEFDKLKERFQWRTLPLS